VSPDHEGERLLSLIVFWGEDTASIEIRSTRVVLDTIWLCRRRKPG
jgi:hypothetical protein